MNDVEGVGTKLWLEEPADHTVQHGSQPFDCKSKKFNFTKKQLLTINNFLKSNKIQWSTFINTIWGVTLNRLSTSDVIIYGTLINAKSIKAIKSSIDNNVSLLVCLKKIGSQLKKGTSAKTTIPSEMRYLFAIENTKTKRSKKNKINFHQYPLFGAAGAKAVDGLTLYYNPDVFSGENIKNLFEHLCILLEEGCKHHHMAAAKLNILSEDEKEILLNRWGRPNYEFNTEKINACFHELVTGYALKSPERIAINHNNINVTYKELETASNHLAYQLIGMGVQPKDHLCLLLERSPTWIVAMVATFKVGAVYVPINPKFPDERIEYVLDDTQAKFILAHKLDRLPHRYHSKVIHIRDDLTQFKSAHAKAYPLPKIDLDSIAYIIYTSGTTGKPKGVMIKHKSLTNLVSWYRGCFSVTENDHSCQFASQGFDSHFCEIVPFLASGASVHIVDDGIKLTPPLFFEWLKQHKITVSDLPTAYSQILFTMPWPDKIHLRLIKIGGEAVTHFPTHVLPFDVWNGYGPTETTVESTYYKVANANVAHAASAHRSPPPIGKPIANNEAYVVDSNLQLVPIGIVGELLIGGECVAAGYLNRDDLNTQKFIPNTYNKSEGLLYRTGDLARWLPDGNLQFVGRIDNQVKIRGYRIELGDIEHALGKHPDVSKAIVLIKENTNHDKSLIAYVVPDLDKERYLYQERCLLSLDKSKFIEAITEDISKGGVALTGVTEKIRIGKALQLHLKLPGFNEPKILTGRVIWQQDNRCGIVFDMPRHDMQIVAKSIDFYISTHNVMEMLLSSSAKRSLRKSLKNKLPEYMVPNIFVTLMQFPLTFSGKIDTKSLPPPLEHEQILHKDYIPAKSETEKKLLKIWSELLHKDRISMSDNFFDLGGSSLTAADLSVRILNQFDTAIPAKILFDLSYIPILAEYIDTKGANYKKESVIQEEIERDCILPENITPSRILIPSVANPKNILLTGAGGFLGIYFLRELLAKTDAKIYCLIRKGEFETAAKRLISTIQKFKLDNEISLSDRRIIAIPSDISYDNFGLPLEQYNSLLDKVDLIYHCGAQVNIMASYNKLRGSNVQGTLEIIKFATRHIDKPIHYISTLSSAYRKDNDGNLIEVFPNDDYSELFGGYAISKWVSERLLTAVKDRGLPIAIYRSGYISGQSDTGLANLNDALFMLIKGCIQLGFAPEMGEKVTILPVDFVSKAITQISLAYPTTSQVYHIDHPTGIMWTDLVAWMNDYGYSVKIIPMREWQKKLIGISQENALFAFLPYYLSLPEQYQSPNVSVDNATKILDEFKLPYPAIDDQLLTIYFDYMVDVNFLPQPGVILQSI